MTESLFVKNMVCPRCIEAVISILNELNINFNIVRLGEIILDSIPNENLIIILKEKLEKAGFELLENDKTALISRIKSLIIEQIHYEDDLIKVNLSTYLADKLHHDYSYLSRLFSSVEGITIEKFTTKQKIEKVKELLFYNEYSLSEIALRMNYSSVSYLSAQFKRETGMTPSEFKSTRLPSHHSLDSL